MKMREVDIPAFVQAVVDTGCDICAVGHQGYTIGEVDLPRDEREAVALKLAGINQHFGDRDHGACHRRLRGICEVHAPGGQDVVGKVQFVAEWRIRHFHEWELGFGELSGSLGDDLQRRTLRQRRGGDCGIEADSGCRADRCRQHLGELGNIFFRGDWTKH
jgi:hypothetical protein